MHTKKKLLLTGITIAFILFIFSNSLYPGTQSSVQSQDIMNLINGVLASCKIHYAFTEHFIRKTGHFTEYFILSILLTFTVHTYRFQKLEAVFIRLFMMLLVPVLDEFIQLFTPGRGSSVSDVLLDFIGGLTAMLIFSAVSSLKRHCVSK
jgi:VanZ family protein